MFLVLQYSWRRRESGWAVAGAWRGPCSGRRKHARRCSSADAFTDHSYLSEPGTVTPPSYLSGAPTVGTQLGAIAQRHSPSAYTRASCQATNPSFAVPPPPCEQEDMYSFVTVADDQTTKGKGTVVVQDA